MRGSVPKSFIHQIVASTDIVELISRYVTLKKIGKNFMGCCPFHDEKTPSFSVSLEKQLYHCFVCHASGDVINFFANYNDLTFIETIEGLASIQGLEVPYSNNGLEIERNNDKKEVRKRIYEALEIANRYFQWNLHFSIEREYAVNYIKLRELNIKVVKDFQIGYASHEWDALSRILSRKFSVKVLVQAGLVTCKNNGNNYDHFRNRLIFPIRNCTGKIVGFGGRILINNSIKMPKYLNSPETLVFSKNHELYGLYELKQQVKSPEYIMIVEGYMDVISLHQHGYINVVATLGTALSKFHMVELFRHTSTIILCFDSDKAGKSAAMRSIPVILPLLNKERKAKFLSLPKEHDPDSFIRNVGLNKFENLLNESLGIVDFFIHNVSYKYNLNSLDSQAQMLNEAKSILRGIPENIYTFIIIKRLAQAINVSSTHLEKIIRNRRQYRYRGINVDCRHRKSNVNLCLIEKALSCLLSIPQVLHKTLTVKNKTEIECITEKHSILSDTLSIVKENNGLSSAILIRMLLEKYPKCENYFYQLLKKMGDELNDHQIINELLAILDKMAMHSCQKELESLISKAKTSVLTLAEKQRLQVILRK